jgi:hypothetical protein
MDLRGRALAPFKQTVAKPKPLGPEYNPWFWNPNRNGGLYRPTADFTRKLADIDPNLAVTWNPINERWQVWSRLYKMQHPLCQGWRLLFIHHDENGGYLPLDNRLFHRLFSASADKWGNAKEYFNAVSAQMERERERMKRNNLQETLDIATPHWEYSQIKNIGKGSKFSTYFA